MLKPKICWVFFFLVLQKKREWMSCSQCWVWREDSSQLFWKAMRKTLLSFSEPKCSELNAWPKTKWQSLDQWVDSGKTCSLYQSSSALIYVLKTNKCGKILGLLRQYTPLLCIYLFIAIYYGRLKTTSILNPEQRKTYEKPHWWFLLSNPHVLKCLVF